MPRPCKCRKINADFNVSFFKPVGMPLCEIEEVELGVDELEAIRLADLNDLYQSDAGAGMNVSRQTFGNILASAHKKIADALVNGKALRINMKNSKINNTGN